MPNKFLVPRNLVLMRAKMTQRFPGPGHCESKAVFCASPVRRILGTLVEGHGDVGSQCNLHIHGVFRREKMRRPIQVRPKLHALLCDLAQLAQAEHLKTAGIRKHRTRPADEAVKSAHTPNRFVSRSKIEVIRVAEDDLGAERLQHILCYGLHRSGSAHRHEDGGFHQLVGQAELRPPAARFGFADQVKLESHSMILPG
jgi:hypothetical protein